MASETLVTIDPQDEILPVRRQTIAWTKAGILYIVTLGTTNNSLRTASYIYHENVNMTLSPAMPTLAALSLGI